MKLVRDVAIKNHPMPGDLEVPEHDELAERRGVGTTNPHPVGLPSLAAAAAQVAAQDLAAISRRAKTPKSTPQKNSGCPQRKMTVK
ncbi:unnamed protein product [Calypogeia fissa]